LAVLTGASITANARAAAPAPNMDGARVPLGALVPARSMRLSTLWVPTNVTLTFSAQVLARVLLMAGARVTLDAGKTITVCSRTRAAMMRLRTLKALTSALHLMNALVHVHAPFGDGARAFQDVKTLAPLMKPKMLEDLIAALLTKSAQENAHARNGAGARVTLDAKTEHE